MPFYGGFEFIEEAIKSLENQTYRNFELIVVDDCFPGIRASEVLHSCNFPWLKIVRHDANKGLASARNTGFENSQGELILPLDDDDLLEPQFLEKTVAALVHDTTAAGAYSQVAIFGEREETWIPNISMLNIMSGIPGPSTILFRRHLFGEVGGFRPGLRSPDSDFWIRVLSHGHRLVRIEEPLYRYRKRPMSLSQKDQCTEVSDLAKANVELYREHLLDVIATQESEVQRLKREYLELEGGFKQLNDGYIDLLARYDEVVRRLQLRSIKLQINRLLSWKNR